MPLLPCHSGLRDIVCCEQKHIDHFPPHNNFPAQSLHFRFGSVAPCPTLKSNVTASTPRTRYGQLAKLYPTGFSYYIQSAYKSKQSFLRTLEEISYADFSARTLFVLYPVPKILYTINHYKKSLGIQNWQKAESVTPSAFCPSPYSTPPPSVCSQTLPQSPGR